MELKSLKLLIQSINHQFTQKALVPYLPPNLDLNFKRISADLYSTLWHRDKADNLLTFSQIC